MSKVTTVALAGKSIPDVLSVLSSKLKSLTKITDQPYKTTGNLEGFGDIKTETKVENLIRAYSSVKGRAEAYENAAKEMGLTTYPQFNISGGTQADWKADILLRKAVIEHSDTEKKLKDLTEKAKRFLSDKQQEEIFLKEIEQTLSEM